MEVRLELLAERYEQESVVITSELVCSWSDRIFKDLLPTLGAIDRVVHHTMILERGRYQPPGRRRGRCRGRAGCRVVSCV